MRDEVGIELEVVDRETEALLAATGCTPLIDGDAEGVILFDIGGGSSELVELARPGASRRGPPPPDLRGWVSLPIGVVTLAERHGGIDVTPRDFRGHGRGSRRATGGVRGQPSTPAIRTRIHLLGTSGTVTTIAGVHLGLKRYDRRRVDGCWMSDARSDRRRASACSP